MKILKELIEAIQSAEIEVLDLTSDLSADTPLLPLPPQWPNTPRCQLHEISRYDERGPAWYWNWFTTGEHTGTHFDAPIHWVSGKDLPNSTVDRISPRYFIGPACVLDAAGQASENPDFLVDVPFIQSWEKQNGRIPRQSWVLLRTGWSLRKSADAFLNVESNGPHTPGWTKEASLFLAVEREVLGVGVETIGTDAGQAAHFDPPFCNHHIMHGNGRFGLTSLINLERLPATGSVVIAAPLKIVGGSGSPLRVIALVPASRETG
ncbi:MAG TPA: cyclase family protein [Acidobacteriota bacterium]|nr:cyclase family protein [Acidobacteriota bacterium]